MVLKVSFTSKALKDLETIEKNNLDKMPICIAKPSTLSDDPSLWVAQRFEITVRTKNFSRSRLYSGLLVK